MTPAPDTSPGGLLTLVRTGRAHTRADLAKLTGLSRGSVSARVDLLLRAGLLRESGDVTATGGRPAGALELNPDAAAVLAVAVGRSRSQAGVFDLTGREMAGDTRDHEPGTSAAELMPSVAGRLDALLDSLAESRGAAPRVVGVGVSLPGTVDPAARASVEAPVLRGWQGIGLEPFLRAVTDAPVHVDNDTAALTRSELFGTTPIDPTMLVVKASTGLGLGIVADGRLVGEGRGIAGELGHTRVGAAGELLCRCGATGCLEALAGGWALVEQLRDQGRSDVRHVRDLVALAQAGDPPARALLRDAGRHLGEVLSVAVNLLQPGAIVVGGDMAGAFDLYTAGVRETLFARAYPAATRHLRLLPAAHGEAGGLHGCAALAIDRALAPGAVDSLLPR